MKEQEFNGHKILDAIAQVYSKSKKCKLNDEIFDTLNSELTHLSFYFKTSRVQAFFISVIMSYNYDRGGMSIRDLNSHFDSAPLTILKYNGELEELREKGILITKKVRRIIFDDDIEYKVNENLVDAILRNKPVPKFFNENINDVYSFLKLVTELANKRRRYSEPTNEFLGKIQDIINDNTQIRLVGKIQQLNMKIEDTAVYLLVIWQVISGRNFIRIADVLDDIHNVITPKMRHLQTFIDESNVLIKENFLELDEKTYYGNADVILTDKSIKFLNENEVKLLSLSSKRDNIIYPDKIPFKELIFSEEEMQQLFLLQDALKQEKLTFIREQLRKNNFPLGITALLHGFPGTGKTEVVKQIAKKTNREIMKVEISQTKAPWFGESEKLIKRIFTDYKAYAENCEQIPILLFNEADAIISKRGMNPNSSADKTGNSMQNILLEEIENFEGILIATTNLLHNIDKAFDRRFLFKIRFKKPKTEVRAKIWKMKIPELTENECNELAGKYQFSGGQIDNIIRKAKIQEVVYGEKAGLEKIISFCEEETFQLKKNKKTIVGFVK